MTALMPPQLPSFQSFLASARSPLSSDSRVAMAMLRAPMDYHAIVLAEPAATRQQSRHDHEQSSRHDEYTFTVHHPTSMSRMYELATLSARAYEESLRRASGSESPCSTTSLSLSSPSPRVDSESDDEQSPRPAASSSSSSTEKASSPQQPHRTKKKYLKEFQRREIVRRVRAGEKQAHLAKEFGVSRAAVCYLLKHQAEILNRSNETTSRCA